MKKIIAIIVMGVILTACASPRQDFSNTGVSERQFATDKQQCLKEMRSYMPTNTVICRGITSCVSSVQQQNAANEYYDSCMTSKGHTK